MYNCPQVLSLGLGLVLFSDFHSFSFRLGLFTELNSNLCVSKHLSVE